MANSLTYSYFNSKHQDMNDHSRSQLGWHISIALIASELLLFILNQRIINMMDIRTPTTVTVNTLTTAATIPWEDL